MHSPFVLLALVSAADAYVAAEENPPVAPAPLALDNPAYSEPARKWTILDEALDKGTQIDLPDGYRILNSAPDACRDTISKARAEAGKPPLVYRAPASPDEPLMIYAVDRREDGCSVMVMKGDTADIRPIPAPMLGPLRVIPAERTGK